MAISTPKDIERLQKQMSEQFARFLEAPQADKKATTADDLKVLIEQARVSLEAAVRDREEGLRMADLRIERRKRALASLKNNLRHVEQKDQTQTNQKPRAKKGVARTE